MTPKEVYEKYKHLDKTIIAEKGTDFHNFIIYDLWQCVKKIVSEEESCTQ
jgi:hypothetical protein